MLLVLLDQKINKLKIYKAHIKSDIICFMKNHYCISCWEGKKMQPDMANVLDHKMHHFRDAHAGKMCVLESIQ
jgi:hypothetical protein